MVRASVALGRGVWIDMILRNRDVFSPGGDRLEDLDEDGVKECMRRIGPLTFYIRCRYRDGGNEHERTNLETIITNRHHMRARFPEFFSSAVRSPMR